MNTYAPATSSASACPLAKNRKNEQAADHIVFLFRQYAPHRAGDPPHDRRRLVRNLSLAALSHGVPGTARASQAGGADGLSSRLLPGACNPKPYSLIFVGSPNWCGTIAPPLASWLAKNDLSGKVILPFYSHCGGVPCDPGRDIAGLCPRADVRKALGVMEGEALLPEVLRTWMNKNGIRSPYTANAG